MKPETQAAIESERDYQQRRWTSHTHTVGEYLLLMEKCLNDAKRQWHANGDQAALAEIRQVATLGVNAMDEHGVSRRPNIIMGASPPPP
jgi:hypothetical protein